MEHDLQADVERVGRIGAISTVLDVVCRTTGLGFAALARVTEDRWIACAVRDEIAFGLAPGGELAAKTTFCDEVRAGGTAVVVDHVAEHPYYRGHPAAALYGVQSGISMPVRLAGGAFFGTLCALGRQPARLETPAVTGLFGLLAELIAFHLDAQGGAGGRLAARTGTDAQQSAAWRETFIAMIGHDLRNPLASIDAGTRVLARTPLSEKAQTIVALMQGTVARMTGLVDNMLDFARGRLAGGLALEACAQTPLLSVLEQVVAELRAAWPGRQIETRFALTEADRIPADPVRLGQLLANLAANALAHGSREAPVRVEAAIAAGRFELSVANSGEPIPPELREKLFQPFVRGAGGGPQGLGLGLYIAREIARAHGGTLEASSEAAETRFTFRMPLQ